MSGRRTGRFRVLDARRSLAFALTILLTGTAVSTSALSASAEEGSGTIVGVVRDSAGAPVVGAQVQASARDGLPTHPTFTGVSGPDGTYVIPDVPVGQYGVGFQHADYHPWQYRGQQADFRGADAAATVTSGAQTRADMILYRRNTTQIRIGATFYGSAPSPLQNASLRVALERRASTPAGAVWVPVDVSLEQKPLIGNAVTYEFTLGFIPGDYRVRVSSDTGNIAPAVSAPFAMKDGMPVSFYLHVYPPTALTEFRLGSNPDILARRGDGALLKYETSNGSSWKRTERIGNGWERFDTIFAAGDIDHQGGMDVLARDRWSGNLWLYGSDGRGGWMPVQSQIGTGWKGFDLLFSPLDFNGNGLSDIFARTPSGMLYLYEFDGFAWKPRKLIGSGWNVFDAVFSPGDFDGDGNTDILARKPTGSLHLYPGDGVGGWKKARVVGTGWQEFDRIFSEGDFDGDGNNDVLARTRAGILKLYPGNGAGGWLRPRVIGSGWQSLYIVG